MQRGSNEKICHVCTSVDEVIARGNFVKHPSNIKIVVSQRVEGSAATKCGKRTFQNRAAGRCLHLMARGVGNQRKRRARPPRRLRVSLSSSSSSARDYWRERVVYCHVRRRESVIMMTLEVIIHYKCARIRRRCAVPVTPVSRDARGGGGRKGDAYRTPYPCRGGRGGRRSLAVHSAASRTRRRRR